MKVIKIAMHVNVYENLEMKNSRRSIFFAARDQSYLKRRKRFLYGSFFGRHPHSKSRYYGG